MIAAIYARKEGEAMKLEELITTLRQTKAVTFPGGPRLTAYEDLLAPMLADALKRLVPANAEVHSGWQTKTLIDPSSGQHEWWLVVDDDLVRVHAVAVEHSRGRRVSARFFPLLRAVPNISVVYGREVKDHGAREIEIVIGMDVDLPTDAEPFKAEAGPDNLEAFIVLVGHLRAAITRARERGGA